jgi:hypothetical protein
MYIGEEAVPKPKEGEALVKVRFSREKGWTHTRTRVANAMEPPAGAAHRSEHSG